MKQRVFVLQTCICIAILFSVNHGMFAKENRLGEYADRISHMIEKNYSLADLLGLREEAGKQVSAIVSSIHEAVVASGGLSIYADPLGEVNEAGVQSVYAAAGGNVLMTGYGTDLGLFAVIEHPDKISTYGHLSQVRVITGERVAKGDILGSFEPSRGIEFYYEMEDKSGNSL